MLTLKNLLPEAYRYAVRALLPVQFPVQVVILYMIQCTDYVLSPEFISNFRKLDAAQAEAMWSIYHAPRTCTLEMIRSLIFNASSWDTRSALRYYIPGFIAPMTTPQPQAVNVEVPAYLRMQRIIEESGVPLLLQQSRGLHGDYVELPEEFVEEPPLLSYVVDTEGAEESHSFVCPLDVEEALCLVRRVRDGRMNLVNAMNDDLSVTLNNDDSVVTEEGFIRII